MSRLRILRALLIIAFIKVLISHAGAQINVQCAAVQSAEAFKNGNSICVAQMNLSISASDPTTTADELLYSYTIDLYSDQKTDAEVSALSLRQYRAGQKPAINNNPWADQNGYPFDANGKYPLGQHRIIWKITNTSGQTAECVSDYIAEDNTPPVLKCPQGVQNFYFPSCGYLNLDIESFPIELGDNCSNNNDIKLYFNSDKKSEKLSFECSDLLSNPCPPYLIHTLVDLFAEDGSGNISECSIGITIEDRLNICPIDYGYLVVEIELLANRFSNCSFDVLEKFATSQKSTKFIDNAKLRYYDLETIVDLSLHKSDVEPYNGITTLDLIRIQQHILGTRIITDPLELISADVDMNGIITTNDMAQIRALITGRIDKFKHGQSWRFIPAELLHASLKEKNAFSFPFRVDFDCKKPIWEIKRSFYLIKIGDVNGSAYCD